MRSKYFVYKQDRWIASIFADSEPEAIQRACRATGRDSKPGEYRAERLAVRERCRNLGKHLPQDLAPSSATPEEVIGGVI